ncbi:MAG: phospho-sugar mutase [Actinomycetota bacterium]|nr:phospho-sugar mutase [Actinomycetota bacterium]
MPAQDLLARVAAWVAADPDPLARAEVRALLDAGTPQAEAELADRFAGPLVFGTAGLRGPLRAGPNGMNRAVVRRAAAGLARFLDAQGQSGPVVIGYDARHGSADFAHDTAAVITATGRAAALLPRPLPTPVLAYAVRHLDAAAGVMVTASHNPPTDNGYKVYLADGAQIAPPVDRDIEAAIAGVGPAAGIAVDERYELLDEAVLAGYLTRVAGLVPADAARELTVAYTPLHGVGAAVLIPALERAGFRRPHVVAEQEQPDPDFPTVAFPNPEEPGAMDRVLALAARTGADLALANDPDADRCAVAVGPRVLSGDEVGVLLADYLLRRRPPAGSFATTIVSSGLLGAMCRRAGVAYAETLTGFKWIVRAAPDLEYGYEEALGYCVDPTAVRDKDGISAALLVVAAAAEYRAQGRTLLDRLDDLAAEYGLHATEQLALRVTDPALIAAAMATLRAAPPAQLAGRPTTSVEDLLPRTDAVRLRADGIRVVVRPSGTEPKLKSYLEVVAPVPRGDVAGTRAGAAAQLARLRDDVAAALGLP